MKKSAAEKGFEAGRVPSVGDVVLVGGKPHIVVGTSGLGLDVEVVRDHGEGRATGEPLWVSAERIG